MKNSILIIIYLFYNIVFSQDPSSIEHNFGANPYFDNSVKTIVYQADSKIIVGGEFTMYNKTSCNRIVRLNPSGQIDTSFNIGTGFNGIVNSIKIQSDGKILVGGNFTKFNGLYADSLVRLNIDGSIDSAFMPYIDVNGDSVFQGGVYCIGIQPNGKILVSTIYNVMRINSNGSLDNTYDNFSSNEGVKQILIQSDGKIILDSRRFNYDGSLDTSFFTTLKPMALQTDGKIICIEPYYINVLFTNQFLIKRLNINGSIDQSFNTGFALFNYSPNKIVVQNDGKILIGGDFTTYNEVNKNYILRLNADGTLDNSFNVPQNVISPLLNGTFNVINEIVVQPDNKIIVGGGNNNFNNYVRLYNDGSKDDSYTGLDGIVECITLQSDNKILVGGSFNSYNGQSKNKIVRYSNNGLNDVSFNIGSGFNEVVKTIVMQPDNKILVGGNFTSFNGVNCGKISRLNNDGTYDNTFITGTGFNGVVNKIAIQSDGKIVVIGTFTAYNNINVNKIVRLNQNGSIDNTFNLESNVDGDFRTMAIQSDGKIYLGGNGFTRNSYNVGAVIKLNVNGLYDTGFSFNGDYSLELVNVILIETTGNIIVAGNEGSNLTGPISRITPNGTIINHFTYTMGACCMGTIKSFIKQPDGKFLIGGSFQFNTTVSQPIGILRLNSDFSLDSTFIPYLSSDTDYLQPVNSVVAQNDGKILVGGDFLYYNKTSFSSFLLRINGVCNVSYLPIASSVQALPNNSMISNLSITGSNVNWFLTSTGGSHLNSSTNLINNTYYYASQTVNGCESNRIPVLVNLYPIANLPSVTIGNKIWSNNNLNVNTYTDGTPIQQVSNPSEWAYLTTGAWCYYNNDPANELGYGKLYNWYAVAGIYDWESLNNPILRKQLAPIGWHIPYYNEWQELSNNNSSNFLRETGTSHWTAPNNGATNSIGFTALPGGIRDISSTSSFLGVGDYGNWWANSLDYINQVNNSNNCNCINNLHFRVNFYNAVLSNSGVTYSQNSQDKKFGMSVRCVKDDVSSLSNNQTNATDNLVNKVKYFPNPVIDILNVQSLFEINNLKINNILGQTIFQNSYNSKSTQINTSDFPSGIYIVTLESEGKKETFKIIKK